MQIISRKMARALGFKHYFTGKPCRAKHVSKRYVISGGCLDCQRDHLKKYRECDREKFNQRTRDRRRQKPEHTIAIRRAWSAENREKIYERNKAYRIANSGKYRAHAMKRVAAKNNATPPWSNLDDILFFYEEAARLTAKTGIPHQVDHIVPLQGKTVCGLHVVWNLQVLPAVENQSKNNHYWPNMWDEK